MPEVKVETASPSVQQQGSLIISDPEITSQSSLVDEVSGFRQENEHQNNRIGIFPSASISANQRGRKPKRESLGGILEKKKSSGSGTLRILYFHNTKISIGKF